MRSLAVLLVLLVLLVVGCAKPRVMTMPAGQQCPAGYSFLYSDWSEPGAPKAVCAIPAGRSPKDSTN